MMSDNCIINGNLLLYYFKITNIAAALFQYKMKVTLLCTVFVFVTEMNSVHWLMNI